MGASASDDLFSQTRYELTNEGTRKQYIEFFESEQALRVEPKTQTHWAIHANANTNAPSYIIEPIRSWHRFERSVVEPYSDYDLFVTVANDCERFASQNARFNSDCLNKVEPTRPDAVSF